MGRTLTGLLSFSAVVSTVLACEQPAFGVQSPTPSCRILPEDIDSEEFSSFEQLPPQIREELKKHFSSPDDGVPLMAPRDAEWQETDVVVGPPLPFRRFIGAGRYKDRWYVWYERGGIAHSFHFVILDLPQSALEPSDVTHFVGGEPDDQCPVIARLMVRQPIQDPQLDSDPKFAW